MYFINTTKNSINLSDVDRIIPFYHENKEQFISSDIINRSEIFQRMCLDRSFLITKIDNSSRIENNLMNLQNNLVNFPSPPIVKLTLAGHFGGNASYSKMNRNLLYSLAKNNIEVNIIPEADIENTGLTVAESTLLKRFVNIPDPDAIVIHSVIPSFAKKFDSKYSILYTTIESSSVPKQFIDACNLYDEIWVTSDFCKNILQPHVKKDIKVIPFGINTNLYTEKGEKHSFTPNLKKFKFISVSSWDYRKGCDVLLRSYLEEFNDQDDVSLLIVTPYDKKRSSNKVEEDIFSAIEKYKPSNHPHIARSGYSIIENDLPKVYRACDAFVLPSRGEGFGIPYLEASMCGLPVIATKYSGHTMFLNEQNAFLVDIDELGANTKTEVHYWTDQLFPKLSSTDFIQNLRKQMRYVFDNKQLALCRNKLLQVDILNKYAQNVVGLLVKDRLEKIWTQL